MNLKLTLGSIVALVSACSSVNVSYQTLFQDSEEILNNHSNLYSEKIIMSYLKDIDGDGDLDIIFTTRDNSTGHEREGVYIHTNNAGFTGPYRR